MTAAQAPAPEEPEDLSPVTEEDYEPPPQPTPPPPLPLRPAPQPAAAQTAVKITETVLPGQQSRILSQPARTYAPVPHPTKAAQTFLSDIMNNVAQRKRCANWKIQVKRLGPAVWRARRLDTTNWLNDGFQIMPMKDLENEVRDSFGGGKYRAEVHDDGGGWQTSWDFGISTAEFPPVMPGGAPVVEGNADLMDPVQKALYETKLEETRAKLKREEEREALRLKREYEEYEEERRRRTEQRDANPALKAIQDQIAESNRRFEKLFEMQMTQHRELLAVLTAKKDDGASSIMPVVTLLVEGMKSSRGEQIEIAKANAAALEKTAQINADAMVKGKEAEAAIVKASSERADKLMELLIKDAKPKDSIGDVMKAMQLVETIRDRFGPEDMVPDESGSILGSIAKAALPLLAGFATRAGTPGGSAAGAAMGLPPGQAPTPAQLPQLAEQLAPLILERMKSQPQLPPAPPLPVMGTTAEIPPASTGGVVNLDAPPPASANAQGPAPAVRQTEAVPAPLEEDMTGSTPAERLREMVESTVKIMIGDARDQRAEATWVDDALRFWNGQFLTNIVSATNDADRIAMIGGQCDPVLWKSLMDILQNSNAPGHRIVYKAFLDGLHTLVLEHRKRMQ